MQLSRALPSGPSSAASQIVVSLHATRRKLSAVGGRSFAGRQAGPSARSLLLYGCDQTLLQTRALVLRRAGFHVDLTSDADQAERLLRTFPPELLIVCHTVAWKHAIGVLSTVHTARPAIRYLLLLSAVPSPTIAWADEVQQAAYGPAALIAKIERMLNVINAPSELAHLRSLPQVRETLAQAACA